MSERNVIDRTAAPITMASLAKDLCRLGVEPGRTLLVHASLSALGWVCGGPVAVILALDGGRPRSARHAGHADDARRPHRPAGLAAPVPEAWKDTIPRSARRCRRSIPISPQRRGWERSPRRSASSQGRRAARTRTARSPLGARTHRGSRPITRSTSSSRLARICDLNGGAPCCPAPAMRAARRSTWPSTARASPANV